MITLILIILVAALILGFGLGPVVLAMFHNRRKT